MIIIDSDHFLSSLVRDAAAGPQMNCRRRFGKCAPLSARRNVVRFSEAETRLNVRCGLLHDESHERTSFGSSVCTHVLITYGCGNRTERSNQHFLIDDRITKSCATPDILIHFPEINVHLFRCQRALRGKVFNLLALSLKASLVLLDNGKRVR